MKIVIIAAIALLLVGGGGAGAYFYFKHPAEAASSAVGEHAEGEKARHKKGGEHEEAASQFVQLDPLILPIVGKDGFTQVVSMVVVIETPDEASKAKIEYLSPRLKDAYIQDMYGVLSQETMADNGVLHVTALKNRLQKVSDKVLGDGMAKDVLLQVVQQRPM
jgi:flagellar FliL protein